MTATGSADVEVHGARVVYELLGPEAGTPIVLTPGGRFGKDVPGLRPLAEALASGGMRVLLWDRPNCGASDVQLWGASESHMRAEVLAGLLQELSLAPCVVAGGSGGARDSLLTAILHPDVVSRLIVWNIVGGVFSTMNLAAYYAIPNLNAVRLGGIDGVLALPEWQTLVAANPRNEQRLRTLGAARFWHVMRDWLDAYVPTPGQTIPGVRDALVEEIAVPTLIVRGGEHDLDHPKKTSHEVHCLIAGSRLVEPPWPEDAWEQAFVAFDAGRGHLFDPWALAAPLILDAVKGP
jgi:2-hydroxy-6-oxonona-2,4-dienedioate hydrolase